MGGPVKLMALVAVVLLMGCASSSRLDDLEARVRNVEEIQDLLIGQQNMPERIAINARRATHEQKSNTLKIKRAAQRECRWMPWRCW
jgi:outer membrane murein-binding lipoprotein Lpp